MKTSMRIINPSFSLSLTSSHKGKADHKIDLYSAIIFVVTKITPKIPPMK